MKALLAPILMLLSSAAFAQDQSANLPRYEFFGGYSVNADYIKNRSVLVALDQKVSPFFSLGSGPYGFEFAVKRYVRNGYSDSFADTGWTLSTGAGFDVRLNKRLSYRLSMDYDPTFLVRPVYRDPVLDSQGRLVLSQPTPRESAAGSRPPYDGNRLEVSLNRN